MTTMLEAGQQMVRGERELFPVARLLGLEMRGIEPGRAVFELAADERHHNPMGTLHGGVYCSIVEAVAKKLASAFGDEPLRCQLGGVWIAGKKP
jgi:acyl-coenzyme A thioesterase PaaI-like protein